MITNKIQSEKISYTKKDILDLIINLKRYESSYIVLIDFFERNLQKGYFDFGLSEFGSQGSAIAIETMKDLFPDVLHALFMPKKELPLFISNSSETVQEYPIACWRLKLDK